ncbi:hypothetical protein O181_011330 [Austropuccinia psidii MF-1]|uniref:Integrase catalytic domain-containing protein n=1 Tax=Austropuccinia psidii MF-1 TaxID=1389203 RepID=A0A9Q3BVQ1_9BASI|nr:hypothetical protein [Austropuccinia psidii MF-1]
MDWVIALNPGGDRSFNTFLVLFESSRKAPMFLQCNTDATAMDTAIMIWNRGIIHEDLFQNIISDKYLKFTLALWKNLHNLFGTKLSLSKAYHPQADGLEERMIPTQ